MRVSYIITTRDERPEILNATLRALARTTSHVEGEIIVVDDGSRYPCNWLVVIPSCCATRSPVEYLQRGGSEPMRRGVMCSCGSTPT